MKLFSSANDLSAKTRSIAITLLNQQLANNFDLYSQIKQAHWNVKGARFYQLHKLFDELAEAVEEHLDDIAERATALGGTALGTVRMAAEASELPELPGKFDSKKLIDLLVQRFAKGAASARAAIDSADESGDKDTADLLTAVSRTLDKSLWLLEAHTQDS